MARAGRGARDLREVSIQRRFTSNPDGSVLIAFGDTRVLCTAVAEDRVPPFLAGKGRGWVTAEYAMLPGSASEGRISRDAVNKGRALEISRLIGRSLRSVVNLKALGERQITVDCDVLQADGGTRTTSINGAWVAVAQALERLRSEGRITTRPLREPVAAVSVGLLDGELLVDLAYDEDSGADVDANFVMTGSGGLVEVQGTAEGRTFARRDLTRMLEAAWRAIEEVNRAQLRALAPAKPPRKPAAKRRRP
jgi:ribonuclease PH